MDFEECTPCYKEKSSINESLNQLVIKRIHPQMNHLNILFNIYCYWYSLFLSSKTIVNTIGKRHGGVPWEYTVYGDNNNGNNNHKQINQNSEDV